MRVKELEYEVGGSSGRNKRECVLSYPILSSALLHLSDSVASFSSSAGRQLSRSCDGQRKTH